MPLFAIRCCLLSLILGAGLVASAATTPDVLYPADSGVIDVKVLYGAKGDGVTDDAPALQKALDDHVGHCPILYLPAGTYLVSHGLTFGADIAKAKFTIIQGQQRDKTTLKLMDAAAGFSDPKSPRCLFSMYDGKSTGQAFANAMCDLTIDTGKKNPGAIGLLFMANNQGTLRDVRIRSGDGAGVRGLDLTKSWPGPFFVQRLDVIGFDVGIDISEYDYSQCYEDITLSQQRVVGLRNLENKVAIRHLKSTNTVPAIQQVGSGGYIHLLDSTLNGGSKDISAIDNHGRVVLRRVTSTGYGSLMNEPVIAAPSITHFDTDGISSTFAEHGKPLDLPIQDAPTIPVDDVTTWITPQGNDDAAIQAAIDQAADKKVGTVYLKPGKYDIAKTIRIHGSVRRFAGQLAELHAVDPLVHSKNAAFIISESMVPAVVIERLWTTPWERNLQMVWFENRDQKTTLILRNILCGAAYRTGANGAGPLFIEDVCGSQFTFGKGQQVWARQINPENHHPLMVCDGATFWGMNLKTEGLQTVIQAINGSKVELFGGYIFPIHAGAPQFPAFEFTDSQAYVSYCEGNITGNSSAYTVHVRETRHGVTHELTREQTPRLGDGTRMTSFSTLDAPKIDAPKIDAPKIDAPKK